MPFALPTNQDPQRSMLANLGDEHLIIIKQRSDFNTDKIKHVVVDLFGTFNIKNR